MRESREGAHGGEQLLRIAMGDEGVRVRQPQEDLCSLLPSEAAVADVRNLVERVPSDLVGNQRYSVGRDTPASAATADRVNRPEP